MMSTVYSIFESGQSGIIGIILIRDLLNGKVKDLFIKILFSFVKKPRHDPIF